ncbi:MAG: DUF2254 domain-containing protein [Dehalococcoidia bacterium]
MPRKAKRYVFAKLANLWEAVTSGLWFIPGLLMTLAVVAGLGMPVIDRQFELEAASGLLFGGTAEAARTLLGTTAAAMITVVAVGFSVTIVAIQQAATQYTPRVLGTFMRNRGNQLVLGAYLATFTYALLVLRQVRDDAAGQGQFVPGLSVTAAVLFALVSIALFIFFMQHIAQQLQSATILQSVRNEMLGTIRRMFPEEFGTEEEFPIDEKLLVARAQSHGAIHRQHIRAEDSGYLRRIDEGQLLSLHSDAEFVHVRQAVGEYVAAGQGLLTIWSRQPIDQSALDRMRSSFILGANRTMVQDPLFGLQQMTDIAVKALSPGINDPSTAAQAMDNLATVLAVLATRQFPNPLRRGGNEVTYLFSVPTFGDYVDSGLKDIHHFGRNNPSTLSYLLRTLDRIAEQVPSAARASVVRNHVERIADGLDSAAFADADKAALREQCRRVTQRMAETVGDQNLRSAS